MLPMTEVRIAPTTRRETTFQCQVDLHPFSSHTPALKVYFSRGLHDALLEIGHLIPYGLRDGKLKCRERLDNREGSLSQVSRP